MRGYGVLTRYAFESPMVEEDRTVSVNILTAFVGFFFKLNLPPVEAHQ